MGIHSDPPAWEYAPGETDGLIPFTSTNFSSCPAFFVVKFPVQMPGETIKAKTARLKKSSPR